MGNTAQILDSVRGQLAPTKDALAEARTRRDLVKDAALGYPGALRAFNSGSIAHGTANCPIHLRDQGLDADGGVVLDRRRHTELGPDGDNIGPNVIVQDVLDTIIGRVKAQYPKAALTITKRAILVKFREPLPSGEDPTVDLVVCLDRRDASGLWIPNTKQRRWDPAHPEKHTDLLLAEPRSVRVTRARAIRLAKAENKRVASVPLCSFNLEAFGLMFASSGGDVASALLALWEGGAADLSRRLTPDPADVCRPLKVEDREVAVRRLERAANHLTLALEHDDDLVRVRSELRFLWPDFISSDGVASSKAENIARLAGGGALGLTAAGGLSTNAAAVLKSPRSYGGLLL